MINIKTNQLIADLTEIVSKAGLPPVNIRLALQVVEAQVAAMEQRVMAQERETAKAEKAEGNPGKQKPPKLEE